MNNQQTNNINDQRTTGNLRNGKPYTARFLQLDDLAMIMQLQEKVKNALQSKANLEPLSREEFTFLLNGNGFMIGIFIAGNLVGFRAMLIPELDDEHLGLDCGLSEHDFSNVIYSEVSCVDPEFRGNGMQTVMGKLLFAHVDTEQFHYICSTVSPNNIPSMKDKLALGMRIVALKEKYNGKLRYILMKNLLHKECLSTGTKDVPVRIDDIGVQQSLLQTGYYGVEVMEKAGSWNVLYRKEKSGFTGM